MNFPLFFHYGAHFYKVMSMEKLIIITHDEYLIDKKVQFMYNDIMIADVLENGDPITEDEFKAAYRTTQQEMDNLAGDEERQRQELNEQIKDEFQFPFPSKCTA